MCCASRQLKGEASVILRRNTASVARPRAEAQCQLLIDRSAALMSGARRTPEPHSRADFGGSTMDCVDLDALEQQARALMAPASYAFCACGADDEVSMAENIAAWRGLRLRPRVLRDVTT